MAVSFFLIMHSAYNFNLYIKDNCSARPHFNVPLSGLYIQVGLCISDWTLLYPVSLFINKYIFILKRKKQDISRLIKYCKQNWCMGMTFSMDGLRNTKLFWFFIAATIHFFWGYLVNLFYGDTLFILIFFCDNLFWKFILYLENIYIFMSPKNIIFKQIVFFLFLLFINIFFFNFHTRFIHIGRGGGIRKAKFDIYGNDRHLPWTVSTISKLCWTNS